MIIKALLAFCGFMLLLIVAYAFFRTVTAAIMRSIIEAKKRQYEQDKEKFHARTNQKDDSGNIQTGF